MTRELSYNQGLERRKLEPAVGIEPTACRLRIDCTTTVLRRHVGGELTE